LSGEPTKDQGRTKKVVTPMLFNRKKVETSDKIGSKND
jgi:hypothetical protein